MLRTIRGGDEGEFIPSLSVAFSVVLAIGGIGTLIYFIHHIASSIQASSIIASVAKETLVAMDRLFSEKPGRKPMDDEADPSLLTLSTRTWQAVMATRNGYLQGVDDAALLRLARKHETIVRMDRGIGECVVQDTPLASLALDDPPDDGINEIRGSAAGNVAIMIRMLDALQTIASPTDSPSRRRVLVEQAECIAELAGRSIESPRDRVRFEERLARAREALETKRSDHQPLALEGQSLR